MDTATAEKYRRRIGVWRCATILLFAAISVTLIAFTAFLIIKDRQLGDVSESSIPCPPKGGGLLTSSDPELPSPFHDITLVEYQRLFAFLQTVKDLNLSPPSKAAVNTSNIFMVDLILPPKSKVIQYLDKGGQQPPREARVIVFRGDKEVPLVEEYVVGPLSRPTYCNLRKNKQRRNPVSFAVRPVGYLEFQTAYKYVLPFVEREVGFILEESYGGKFTDCGDTCLYVFPSLVGTELLGEDTRKNWFTATFSAEYYSLHLLDFSVLINMSDRNPSRWHVEKVWYSGNLYSSLSDLASQYRNTRRPVKKTKINYVRNSHSLYSSQNLRGNPVPHKPQRPPVQFEPDGKRYYINHRHIKYMEWDFHFRMSTLTGPQIHDVRFRGERIAYEIGVSEISVFYSGNNPPQRINDFVDSGALLGIHSKSLIPGVDCPEGATFLNMSVLGEGMESATTLAHSSCVFELNTGLPLRRHMSYSKDEGAFFGGVVDSVLTIRSILTIVNYDYIIDFIFRQSGALEVRVHSTGYILTTFYRPEEEPYGFHLHKNIIANIHHHMFHIKADIDIKGTANRYETLDISQETVNLTQVGPRATYAQTRFTRNLRKSEMDALYKFNFDHPKYHIVHNNGFKSQYDVPRAFRLHLAGMSKQMIPENLYNEKTIPWARHQMAVTVQKDDEVISSSPYAMFDSLNPVTNFENFYKDNESIVDKDLVFWIAMGTHHIPHTEDLPVTPTPGGQLSFFLLPYNYFPECPSTSARDAIRVEYVKSGDPSAGLRVERYGNKVNDACGAVTLEDLVRERADDVVQTNREIKMV